MSKWRLLLTVLPFTALFSLGKVGLHQLGFEPWAFDSLTGSLFGAATFVIAFVLSGTLAAYNDSEGMLLQIVNAVETIEDTNLLYAAIGETYDPKPLCASLASLLNALVTALEQGNPLENVRGKLAELNRSFQPLQEKVGPSVANRLQEELAKLRILIQRIDGIRSTSFLEPAYALLEIFLIGAVLALLLIGADRFSENLVVSCFLFTSFCYLLLLIKDLDNPFQYNGRSCVEADLSTLKAAAGRLQSVPSSLPAPTQA